MKLTLESLLQVGAFTGGPVKRVVEWVQNGEALSADVYIRPLSYFNAVSDIAVMSAGKDLVAHRLATCVCSEEGMPVFRVSDITGHDEDGMPIMVERDGTMVERGPLNKSLSDALMVLVVEVSGLGKSPLNSSLRTSSGTNSSSTGSVDEPSKKRSEH